MFNYLWYGVAVFLGWGIRSVLDYTPIDLNQKRRVLQILYFDVPCGCKQLIEEKAILHSGGCGRCRVIAMLEPKC